MYAIYQILQLLLSVAWFFVLAHLIFSWLIAFNVLNTRQPLVAQIWYGLQRMMEPIYAPIRRYMPDLGGIDLSPLVVFIGIQILSIILQSNVGLFL